MQTNKEAEQVTLSDLGICCGKMFQEPSPAELPKARTSVSSSKRSSELSAVPFISLDLTPGHGNLLGESYWELISPWLGGAWMLNTEVSPNDARGSSLSQILQDAPPIKYYLSPKACLGILRRASERGKALPPKLERALKIQAGLMRPDGQPTDLNAFHINQRDEGIDLHGVSGALMATTNMQMQTFVTQPDDTVEGFDGYNGDLTGDVAATLGANCGMSTGRNGVMAFAANQRDEVRDLHDVAGALNAQPGMKQQTFVCTNQNDDWLNIYANYDVEQDRLCNTLDLNLCKGDGSEEDWSYPLNAAEQEVLLCKMEAFCQQQTGMSLHEYARQLRDSETQAPEMQM